ncbi:hypothetical protein [Endozoicomonas sp. Mp262]
MYNAINSMISPAAFYTKKLLNLVKGTARTTHGTSFFKPSTESAIPA